MAGRSTTATVNVGDRYGSRVVQVKLVPATVRIDYDHDKSHRGGTNYIDVHEPSNDGHAVIYNGKPVGFVERDGKVWYGWDVDPHRRPINGGPVLRASTQRQTSRAAALKYMMQNALGYRRTVRNPVLKRRKTVQDYPFYSASTGSYHHPTTGAALPGFEGRFTAAGQDGHAVMSRRRRASGEHEIGVADHYIDSLGRWKKRAKNPRKLAKATRAKARRNPEGTVKFFRPVLSAKGLEPQHLGRRNPTASFHSLRAHSNPPMSKRELEMTARQHGLAILRGASGDGQARYKVVTAAYANYDYFAVPGSGIVHQGKGLASLRAYLTKLDKGGTRRNPRKQPSGAIASIVVKDTINGWRTVQQRRGDRAEFSRWVGRALEEKTPYLEWPVRYHVEGLNADGEVVADNGGPGGVGRSFTADGTFRNPRHKAGTRKNPQGKASKLAWWPQSFLGVRRKGAVAHSKHGGKYTITPGPGRSYTAYWSDATHEARLGSHSTLASAKARCEADEAG